MKKVLIVLLVVSLVLLFIPLASNAGGRGHGGGYYGGGHYSRGYHDRGYYGGYYRGYGRGYYGGYYGRGYYGYSYHDQYYWRDLGATMAIIGGLAITNAIINAPYQNYDYGYRECEKEIRYGHWEYDPYGGRRWITTRVEIVPCY
jgi:uncharacterized membrane protein